MDPLKLRFLEEGMQFVAFIVGMGCFTGIVTSWFRRRAPKGIASSSEILGRLNEITDRLDRLDNSVDAMAVEVERISEGQRFTTRLLTERAPATVPGIQEKGRSTTPH